MDGGLLDYVLRRLREEQASGISLSAIARACDLKPRWVTTLASGTIPEPGVGKIERLATYLRQPRPAPNKSERAAA